MALHQLHLHHSENFWPFLAACLTVFLFEFWPQASTTKLQKKFYKSRGYDFEEHLPLKTKGPTMQREKHYDQGITYAWPSCIQSHRTKYSISGKRIWRSVYNRRWTMFSAWKNKEKRKLHSIRRKHIANSNMLRKCLKAKVKTSGNTRPNRVSIVHCRYDNSPPSTTTQWWVLTTSWGRKAGGRTQRPCCAIPFYASPRVTKACTNSSIQMPRYCNHRNVRTWFNFVYFVLLAESTKFCSVWKPCT